MITKKLIELVYSAASIQRWNDHPRPLQFTEVDKQAHKMIIAYVLARFEEDARGAGSISWKALIEGGLCEFLHRIMLTDIKPAVFHEMMSKKGKELNRWVLGALEKDISPLADGFRDTFERYFSDPGFAAREKGILRAAHYIATNWEFRIIYHMAPFLYGIEATKTQIESQIEDHCDLAGVKTLLSPETGPYGFVDLCGQLRFQQRWAQSPRLPRTSVLGHMLIVAILSYLCALEIGAGGKRGYNIFFSALMHDLPEVLTKDIVHPVKRSVSGLDAIIRAYEKEQVDKVILPLLPPSWHDEIRYFVQNEFDNKIRRDGKTEKVDEIEERYGADEFSPLDGRIIEVCDKYAAFVEVALSAGYGLTSKPLAEAQRYLYRDFHGRVESGFSFKRLFDYWGEG